LKKHFSFQKKIFCFFVSPLRRFGTAKREEKIADFSITELFADLFKNYSMLRRLKQSEGGKKEEKRRKKWK